MPHLKTMCWSVFALALALRLLYAAQLQSSPLYDYPVVDGKTYVMQAVSLAGGNWLGFGQGPYWQPPLYPFFLGALKAIFPDAFFNAVRWLQALFGAATCALTCLLGARLFDPRVGLSAGIAAALCGSLIFFDGELLPATLAVLLNLCGLLLLHRALRDGRLRSFVGAGLVFGLAALTVPTVLVFVGIAVVWAFCRRGARSAALLLLGVALAVVPVSVRNLLVGGAPVLISSNSGINYYIGNNAEYERTFSIRPGWEWDDLVHEPSKKGITQPTAKSAYFWGKATDYIAAHPLDWIGLQLHKACQLFAGHEHGRNQDIYYWRQYAPVLALTLWKYGLAFPFGLIGPLALVGLGLILYHRRRPDLTVLFVLAYSAGIIAFFPTARYRAAMLPTMLILAAYAFWWLWEAMYQSRAHQGKLDKAFWTTAAALGLLLIAANFGAGPMNMAGDAEIHYNLGQAHAHKRRAAEAEAAYARAVELDPNYWQAWVNLGSVKAIQGQLNEASAIFERVTAARPQRPEVWVNLANSRTGLGQFARAEDAYNQALKVNPRQPRLYMQLMQLHLQQADSQAARRVLDRAIKEYPRDRQKLQGLFTQLLRQQRQPPLRQKGPFPP